MKSGDGDALNLAGASPPVDWEYGEQEVSYSGWTQVHVSEGGPLKPARLAVTDGGSIYCVEALAEDVLRRVELAFVFDIAKVKDLSNAAGAWLTVNNAEDDLTVLVAAGDVASVAAAMGFEVADTTFADWCGKVSVAPPDRQAVRTAMDTAALGPANSGTPPQPDAPEATDAAAVADTAGDAPEPTASAETSAPEPSSTVNPAASEPVEQERAGGDAVPVGANPAPEPDPTENPPSAASEQAGGDPVPIGAAEEQLAPQESASGGAASTANASRPAPEQAAEESERPPSVSSPPSVVQPDSEPSDKPGPQQDGPSSTPEGPPQLQDPPGVRPPASEAPSNDKLEVATQPQSTEGPSSPAAPAPPPPAKAEGEAGAVAVDREAGEGAGDGGSRKSDCAAPPQQQDAAAAAAAETPKSIPTPATPPRTHDTQAVPPPDDEQASPVSEVGEGSSSPQAEVSTVASHAGYKRLQALTMEYEEQALRKNVESEATEERCALALHERDAWQKLCRDPKAPAAAEFARLEGKLLNLMQKWRDNMVPTRLEVERDGVKGQESVERTRLEDHERQGRHEATSKLAGCLLHQVAVGRRGARIRVAGAVKAQERAATGTEWEKHFRTLNRVLVEAATFEDKLDHMARAVSLAFESFTHSSSDLTASALVQRSSTYSFPFPKPRGNTTPPASPRESTAAHQRQRRPGCLQPGEEDEALPRHGSWLLKASQTFTSWHKRYVCLANGRVYVAKRDESYRVDRELFATDEIRRVELDSYRDSSVVCQPPMGSAASSLGFFVQLFGDTTFRFCSYNQADRLSWMTALRACIPVAVDSPLGRSSYRSHVGMMCSAASSSAVTPSVSAWMKSPQRERIMEERRKILGAGALKARAASPKPKAPSPRKSAAKPGGKKGKQR